MTPPESCGSWPRQRMPMERVGAAPCPAAGRPSDAPGARRGARERLRRRGRRPRRHRPRAAGRGGRGVRAARRSGRAPCRPGASLHARAGAGSLALVARRVSRVRTGRARQRPPPQRSCSIPVGPSWPTTRGPSSCRSSRTSHPRSGRPCSPEQLHRPRRQASSAVRWRCSAGPSTAARRERPPASVAAATPRPARARRDVRRAGSLSSRRAASWTAPSTRWSGHSASCPSEPAASAPEPRRALAQHLMIAGHFDDSAAVARAALQTAADAAALDEETAAERGHATCTLGMDAAYLGDVEGGPGAASRRPRSSPDALVGSTTSCASPPTTRHCSTSTRGARRRSMSSTRACWTRPAAAWQPHTARSWAATAADILFQLGRWHEAEVECRPRSSGA